MSNEAVREEKDLEKVVNGLVDDFTKQLQALTTIEAKYNDGFDDWEAQNLWYFDGRSSVFDDHLSVDVQRIWINTDDGWLHFDPRPGKDKEVTIKLSFDLRSFGHDEWNQIADELDERIEKLSLIQQKKK